MKKPRFIPAERAHHWARKLQARRLGNLPEFVELFPGVTDQRLLWPECRSCEGQ